MLPPEQPSVNEHKTHGQKRRRSLVFFETVDEGRTHLRFTSLAVILIVGLIVVSIGSILVLFLLNSQQITSEPVNVNVSVPSPSPYLSNKPILRPPPPAPQPPKVEQPVYSMPTPPNTQPPEDNFNGQKVPRETPQNSPSPPLKSPP
jgi:hypothetical protein